MKHYRILLFVFAALFAPQITFGADVQINALTGPIAGFHAVFAGNSDNVKSFANVGNSPGPFTVKVGTVYDVFKNVNGMETKIGTVSFSAAGVATYVPAP
ncbi:MAG: hypothetical protein ABIZ81_10635 [Opitutaceae bacterium]